MAKGFMAYKRADEAAAFVAMLRAADVGSRNFSDTFKAENTSLLSSKIWDELLLC